MKIIRPVIVTDSIVTANNITPSAYPEWDIGTAYVAGNKVKIEALHNEWECLIANTGQNPSNDPIPVDGGGNPYWLDLGSTNDWALFDGRSRKASENNLNITVSVQPQQIIDSLAVLNISSDTLNITAVSASAGVVLNQDFVLRQPVYTYYSYCFDPIESIDTAIKLDMPPYSDLTITLTATSSGTVSIGEFIFGTAARIGLTQYGTSLSIRDFSTKDFDLFGNAIVNERGYADRIEYNVLLNSENTYFTKKLLARYRATPLVYIGNEQLPETVVYGFYKNFNEVLRDYAFSSMVLEVEELI